MQKYYSRGPRGGWGVEALLSPLPHLSRPDIFEPNTRVTAGRIMKTKDVIYADILSVSELEALECGTFGYRE